MTRFGGARHPRWNRALIAGAFIASIATGASLGVDQRVEPATVAAAATLTAVSRPGATRLLTTSAVPFFVVPQPTQYTPYGTRVTIPAIGVPAELSLGANSAARQPTCNLITGTISEKVSVTDDAGNPVAGAYVAFTVIRSDMDEPQKVSDRTGFDGLATVTVKVPEVSATPGSSVATYSILAEAFGVDTQTPAASLRFNINDYTCTGGAGAR